MFLRASSSCSAHAVPPPPHLQNIQISSDNFGLRLTTPLMCAGADFMLIPSRFEPCGLIQLHAMQYGTVPLVSTTGGLVDTVKDGVTGFHLGKMDPDKLLDKDAQAVAQGMIRCCLDLSVALSVPLTHLAHGNMLFV